ncbi:MAG TPA: ROK family protein, partial [Candidatus Limnocylindria bacterium]|nr:ROK family protein [Candidatus Limnocylindria bacterium]
IGVNAEELFSQLLGRQVHAINDADAAGLAEVHLGAGRGQHGTVLLLTLGTGIGSALFTHRRLVPNTELGHLEYRGFDAETELSGSARQRRRLSHEDWALEFNGFLARLEDYLWPDLIILGGGLSKSLDQFRHALVSRAPVVGARFRNAAGIIGAALAADQAGR